MPAGSGGVSLGDVGSIVSAAVAVVALLHGLVTRKRAGEARLMAKNADLRAEEALRVAKDVAQIEKARHLRETTRLEGEKIVALGSRMCCESRSRDSSCRASILPWRTPFSSEADLEAFKILQGRQAELSLAYVRLDESTRIMRVGGLTLGTWCLNKPRVRLTPRRSTPPRRGAIRVEIAGQLRDRHERGQG
jgi:hypothetical protein